MERVPAGAASLLGPMPFGSPRSGAGPSASATEKRGWGTPDTPIAPLLRIRVNRVIHLSPEVTPASPPGVRSVAAWFLGRAAGPCRCVFVG
jgi:hypothetical protein